VRPHHIRRFCRPRQSQPDGLRPALAAAIFDALLDHPDDPVRAEKSFRRVTGDQREIDDALARFRRVGGAR